MEFRKTLADMTTQFKKIDKRSKWFMLAGLLFTFALYILAALLFVAGDVNGDIDFVIAAEDALKTAPYMAVAGFVCGLLGDIIIKHDLPPA